MQRTRIGAGGDDGTVGESCLITDEFVRKLSLNLALSDTRFDESQNPTESLAGQLAGSSDQLDFSRRFLHAQPVQQPRQSLTAVQRILGTDPLRKPGLTGLDHNLRPLVLVRIQIHMIALAHQPMEQLGKLRQPVHMVYTARFSCFLLRQLVALPQFQFRLRFA